MKNFYLLIFIGISSLVNSTIKNSLDKKLPLSYTTFRENRGQVADQNYKARPDVLFSGTDGNFVFHLKQTGISYQLAKVLSWKKADSNLNKFIASKKGNMPEPEQVSIYRIDLNWLNCNSHSIINKGEKINGYDNFYTEACPNGALEVNSYKDLTYKNLYQGIDLKWYEKNGALKYDYLISAGADYRQIKLEYSGAEKLSLNSEGDLIIKTPLGDMIEEAPQVIQEGKKLQSSCKIDGNILSFYIVGIDSKKSFVIDPLVRQWATFYGGSGYDWIGTVYTDASANLFVSGGTTSSNLQTIATTGAFQTTYAGSTTIYGDSYLVKFNSAGQRQWGTYFGGSGTDFAYACAVDGNGDVYIAGGTNSTNTAVMTTPGCQQSVCYAIAGNNGDAFLAKFNTSGARIWSTYYGQNGNEAVNGVNCDLQGNVYICGFTSTANNTLIASSGSHQTNFGGGATDGFLVKYNSLGVRQWGTYYGGSGDDQSYNCITDAAGNVYMGGITSSSNSISTSSSHQPNYGGGGAGMTFGFGDAFLAKFNSAGVRQWGSYYGGTGDDGFYYSGIDTQGNVYFSGSTSTSTGTAIASLGCHQPTYGGGTDDAMLAKFDASGVRQWGTYYGGAGLEEFVCCFVEKGANSVYLSGITASGGTNIATSCAYQSAIGGSKDAFLAKFNLQGSRIYGTYYGGIGVEDWSVLAVDGLSNVYLGGEVNGNSGTVIPTAGAHQVTYGGGTYDAFVVKFNSCVPVAPVASTLQVCKGTNGILSLAQTCGLKWYNDSLGTNLLYIGGIYTTSPLSTDTAFWVEDVSCGLASNKTKINVHIALSPTLNIAASTTFVCLGETTTLTASGAQTYTWAGTQSTLQTIVLTPTSNLIQPVDGTDIIGCKGTKSIYIQFSLCTGLNENSKNKNFDFEIYPNPNNGEFILNANSDFEFSIYNQLGQKISEFKLKQENNSAINLKNLTNGIYLIVGKNEMRSITRKLIIE